MRSLVAGECTADNTFRLVEPTSYLEGEFEGEVVRALACLLPDYRCGVFAGAFVLEGERRVADLALIHRTLSHWFVGEVELAGHSLEGHVLPQVRCFRYGDAEESCTTSLMRGFADLSREHAEMILSVLPRHVVVVGNVADPDWTRMLSAVDAQHLTVSVYKTASGRMAYQVEGQIAARAESLGFWKYSAVDNCMRVSKTCPLPIGEIQILDQFGNLTEWVVREANDAFYLCKARGPALLPHESWVQIIRTADGRLALRPTRA